MINLTRVRKVLADVQALVDELDGKELDEVDAISLQSKTKIREIRARRSQDLQLLATRLEMAAALVRNEYWYARGEPDLIDDERN